MKNILVTGSEGFIGRNIVERLLVDQNIVYGIDSKKESHLSHLRYKFIPLDILDRKGLKNYFESISFETIIHLAALTTHDEIMGDKEGSLRTNIEGVINLLDEFKKSKANKFIYSSTGKVYGAIRKLPIDEDHPTNPLNVLGKAKLIAEKIIDFYAYDTQKQYIILRIFNVYGPYQRDNFLIPTIISQIVMAGDKVTLGNISDKRDYIYIDDLVSAISLLEKKILPPGVNCFNIGSGKSYSALDVVHATERILGRSISIEVDQSRFRKDEFPEEYCDNRKLISFGWTQRYNLETGLKKTISYFQRDRLG